MCTNTLFGRDEVMIIDSSSVNMASKREYSKIEAMESISSGQEIGRIKVSNSSLRKSPELKSEDEVKYDILLKILGLIRGDKFKDSLTNEEDNATNYTIWRKTTADSYFFSEEENTRFDAVGVARTKDGREINFGVSLEMSRSFEEQFSKVTTSDYMMTDPLVINLEGNAANISDQKFLFDIDNDGTMDNISFAQNGSGFLAYDKNGDGKINNGSELFGTKSGNGFKELAEYDRDGNGWIDEADDIFDKLKIWTKDEFGNDELISLKRAGVGAIFLGSVSTEFSSNNATSNNTNGIIRRTGVFLKENGESGTIQHVDLAV